MPKPKLSPELIGAVEIHTANAKLPTELVAAMVQVESAGDVRQWRVEPPYRYLFDISSGRPFRGLSDAEIHSERAPRDFPWHAGVSSRDSEWWGQQASWGPMQVMGAVARECGFRGPFPALCSADLGVLYGVIHLETLYRRFFRRYGWGGVVAAYNAGSPRFGAKPGVYRNQRYVNKVGRYYDLRHQSPVLKSA